MLCANPFFASVTLTPPGSQKLISHSISTYTRANVHAENGPQGGSEAAEVGKKFPKAPSHTSPLMEVYKENSQRGRKGEQIQSLARLGPVDVSTSFELVFSYVMTSEKKMLMIEELELGVEIEEVLVPSNIKTLACQFSMS